MSVPGGPRIATTARRGLHRVVVDELGARIVRGDLPVGQALPTEDDLSAELGVSRTTVREAIKVLASKGLVDARRKTGTRVLARDRWSLIDADVLLWQTQAGPAASFSTDLTEVRMLIEPRAAGLAASRRTAIELDRLAEFLAAMSVALDDSDRYTSADLSFHQAILRATHNEVLTQMMSTIGAALTASRLVSNQPSGGTPASIPAHSAVFEAIRDGDPDGAESAMRRLIKTARDNAGRVLGPDPDERPGNQFESSGIVAADRT